MPIKHFGSTTYALPDPNDTIVLKNLLHIPHINKNLVSVSQFSKGNNVYFEFYPDVCYMKNQETK